jgi:YbbR domain-containing protein
VDFESQFDLKEGIILNPKEIEITGPAAIIDTINFLYTKKETFEKLDADLVKTIEIIHPVKTSVKPEKVSLKIPVEKFTEKDIKIRVQIKNKPDDKNIKLFPSEIELTVLVGLSEFENVEGSNFDVFVDLEKIDANSENIPVSVRSNIPNVKIIRFRPETVEYLIETR